MTDRPEPRVLRDPQDIKALAHPLRIALLEVLAGEGTATATRCAEITGESVASCSFHLRTLHKHGFIERAPGEGREKPWRLTSITQEIRPDDDDAGRALRHATDDLFLDLETRRIRAWLARQDAEPEEWREVTGLGASTAWLGVEEVRELRTALTEVVERFFVARAVDPASRPPDARPVRLFLATSVGLGTGIG